MQAVDQPAIYSLPCPKYGIKHTRQLSQYVMHTVIDSCPVFFLCSGYINEYDQNLAFFSVSLCILSLWTVKPVKIDLACFDVFCEGSFWLIFSHPHLTPYFIEVCLILKRHWTSITSIFLYLILLRI